MDSVSVPRDDVRETWNFSKLSVSLSAGIYGKCPCTPGYVKDKNRDIELQVINADHPNKTPGCEMCSRSNFLFFTKGDNSEKVFSMNISESGRRLLDHTLKHTEKDLYWAQPHICSGSSALTLRIFLNTCIPNFQLVHQEEDLEIAMEHCGIVPDMGYTITPCKVTQEMVDSIDPELEEEVELQNSFLKDKEMLLHQRKTAADLAEKTYSIMNGDLFIYGENSRLIPIEYSDDEEYDYFLDKTSGKITYCSKDYPHFVIPVEAKAILLTNPTNTGKTIQILCYVCWFRHTYPDMGPALVTMSSKISDQWIATAKESFDFPGLVVIRKKTDYQKVFFTKGALDNADLVIVTTNFMVHDFYQDLCKEFCERVNKRRKVGGFHSEMPDLYRGRHLPSQDGHEGDSNVTVDYIPLQAIKFGVFVADETDETVAGTTKRIIHKSGKKMIQINSSVNISCTGTPQIEEHDMFLRHFITKIPALRDSYSLTDCRTYSSMRDNIMICNTSLTEDIEIRVMEIMVDIHPCEMAIINNHIANGHCDTDAAKIRAYGMPCGWNSDTESASSVEDAINRILSVIDTDISSTEDVLTLHQEEATKFTTTSADYQQRLVTMREAGNTNSDAWNVISSTLNSIDSAILANNQKIRTLTEKIENIKTSKTTLLSAKSRLSETFECPICLDSDHTDSVIYSSCGHQACAACATRTLEVDNENPSRKLYACSLDRTVQQVQWISRGSIDPRRSKWGSKIYKMLQVIEDIDDDQVLVFVQGKDQGAAVSQALAASGITVGYMFGISAAKHLREFKQGVRKVLVLPISRGINGLHLPNANHVFFVSSIIANTVNECVAIVEQCKARAIRLGQNKVVYIYYMTAKDSPEEGKISSYERRPYEVLY